MRTVGLRAADDGPADGASRPVALAYLDVGHEGTEFDGARALPLALLVTVVRDARTRAHARARDNGEAGMGLDEVLKLAHASGILAAPRKPARGGREVGLGVFAAAIHGCRQQISVAQP